jgi:hypothetical protein
MKRRMPLILSQSLNNPFSLCKHFTVAHIKIKPMITIGSDSMKAKIAIPPLHEMARNVRMSAGMDSKL